jgi:hypothetical protein
MFERVGNLAERVATNVSRRAFLGRLGQGALGLVAAIGGVLAFPADVQAGNNHCCLYASINGPFCFGRPVNGVCSGGKPVACKTCPNR